MRRAGFSRGKVRAIKHIARKARTGFVPTRRACHRLSDEAIIERLTELHGVGQWTAEMLLMFCLGRPDVLPVDDLGLRRAAQRAFGLAELPKAADLEQLFDFALQRELDSETGDLDIPDRAVQAIKDACEK